MPEVTFIHTADLHTRESSEESLQLLVWLMDKCVERNAALLVSGDFFDSEDEARRLREKVKEIFSRFPDIPKFVLPGNHDTEAFPEGADYGPEFYPLNTPPFTLGYHEDVTIAGFPFVSNSSLRTQLEEYHPPGRPLVAMAHGTYFGRGNTEFAQDVRERGQEYFPIYSSDLEDIEADYAALGHYHAQHASFAHSDMVVCYPGTPLALTARETGIRTVVAVTMDSETGDVDIERLPVPVGVCNIRQTFEVFACEEEETLARLERFLEDREDARVSLTVRLKGNIHMLEREMNNRLAELREKYTSRFAKLVLRNETISYRSLIDARPLVRDFMARLAAIKDLDEETRARALELGFHAFEKVKGRLR